MPTLIINGGTSILTGTSGGGGGSGAITVKEDGTIVVSSATSLNFTGGVSLTDDGSGEVTISVSGVSSLQGAYDGGNTIVTDGSDIDVTLGVGDDFVLNSVDHIDIETGVQIDLGENNDLVVNGSGTNSNILLGTGTALSDFSLEVANSGAANVYAGDITINATGPLPYDGRVTILGNTSVYIDATYGAINIGTSADAYAMNLGTNGVRTITVGNTTGASALKLNAGTGKLTLNDGYCDASTWDGYGINLSAASSEWTDFKTEFGEVSLLNAISQAAGGGISVKDTAGTTIVGEATSIKFSGSGVAVTEATPGSGDAVVTITTVSSLQGAYGGGATITTSGSPITFGLASGGFTVNGSGAVDIGYAGTDVSTFNVGAGSVDIRSSAGTVALSSAGALNLSGTTGDWQSTGAVTIDSSGGAISIGSDADGYAVNLGTAGTRTVTVGSTTSTSATTIRSGTGAMTFTSGNLFDVNATGAINLDSSSSSNSNFTTTNGDLILSSTAKSVVITGAEAAVDAIQLNATTALGGIDINAGTGGITIDSGGTFSIDGSSASNLSVTGGNLSVQTLTSGTLAVTSAGALNLSGTTGDWQSTGAVTIDSSGGAISIGSDADAQTINIGTGAAARTINLGTGAGVIETINIGGTGANVITIGNGQTSGSISMGTAMTGGSITIGNTTAAQTGSILIGTGLTTGALTLGGTGGQTGTISLGTGTGIQTINLATGGTGAKTVTVGSTASTSTLTLQAGTGTITVTAGGAFDVNAAGAVTIDSSGSTISIGGDAVAQAINIGTGAAARTITMGNSTGATSVVLNAGTGGVSIGTNAIAKTVTVGSTTTTSALTLQSGSGAMTFTVGGIFDVNAVDAVTIDSSGGAISIGNDANGGAISIGTGSAARTISIGNTTGATSLTFQTGTGPTTYNSGGAFDVNASGAVTIDGVGVSNLTSTGVNSTLEIEALGGGTNQVIIISAGTGANAVRIQASDAAGGIDIDSGTNGITVDSTGPISIDSVGTSNITNASGNLTVGTTTSGVLALSSAGNLTISDGNRSGSTFGNPLALSSASSDWSTYESNFGSELSLIAAINTLYSMSPTVPYDVSGEFSGTPPSSSVFFNFLSARSWNLLTTGSVAACTTAPTGSPSGVVFDIQKGGVSIGSITYSNGSTTGTVSISSITAFSSGNVLTIVAPSNLYGLSTPYWTLVGNLA